MNTGVLLAGRYEVRGRLGRGGMAEVCDGWDCRLRRPVAIKLMHPVVSAQSGMRNRFDAEAYAAAALNHPNIVGIYDIGEHDGRPFIVMERLPGGTLADEVRDGPLPQERVHVLLDNVLAALTAAHRAAILHRDIKPGNILLAEGGEVMKVADFGIAKTPEATNTLTGHILGTIAYLSPERLAGAPACVTDDLYAVGVVGYEALAGHRPFPQENMAALAGAILHGHAPQLAGLRPDVEPGLIRVIERAIARDPRQRFASAEEMRAGLHHRRTAAAAMPVPPPPHPATKLLEVPVPGSPTNTFFPALVSSTSSRRRKVLSVLAVLAVLILVPLALALDASSSHAPTEPVTTTSSAAPVPVSNAPPPPSPTQQPPAPPVHGPGKGHGKGKGGDQGD
ncbi:MAG: serine/threonine protein kinase [Mycobacterium sp.]|uniref:serine/threonine-protein kinase n=1 Tax=Mycobacterium sp. TaxID=1785 RepID=UPI001EB721C7|nr:serine/threonine-protein kinase [Mycobacterium sp.]MBV8785227.1 serine/threonine protein kinase [Mycobacterium sp.]